MIAIVAPVGTETEKVWRSIRVILGSFSYVSRQLRVSWFFEDQRVAAFLSRSIQRGTEYERLTTSRGAGDSLSMSGEEAKVQLIPFVGIGPRRYVELFMLRDPFGNPVSREAAEGGVVEWNRGDAWPLPPDLLINYWDMEDEAFVKLKGMKGILGGGVDGREEHA